MSDTISVANGGHFQRGDRVEIAGRRAVVKRETSTSITIAYRDAWYWRLVWRVEDFLRRIFR